MRSHTVHNIRRNAFTLIELLLVMVILVVLAAIVLPKFAGRSEQAHVTAAIQQINNFKTALDSFEVDNGQYPTSEQGLRALSENTGNWQNWHGPYMESAAFNDPWGNAYIYRFPGTHGTDFDLFSMGPDKREGGNDDIVSWGTSGK